MEQLVFKAIKKALSTDKERWQAGIGIFDNMLEENEVMKLADEKKPGSFRLGKVHQVFKFLRVSKAILFKKINNETYYKWTEKLEDWK